LINDGLLKVVRKFDRSVVINTYQSSNDFVLNLIRSESALLAEDTDYELWNLALGHPFKAIMNRILYEDEYLIPDCSLTFPRFHVLYQNLSTESQSQLSLNQ
jgi:hypothetical protein